MRTSAGETRKRIMNGTRCWSRANGEGDLAPTRPGPALPGPARLSAPLTSSASRFQPPDRDVRITRNDFFQLFGSAADGSPTNLYNDNETRINSNQSDTKSNSKSNPKRARSSERSTNYSRMSYVSQLSIIIVPHSSYNGLKLSR